MITIPPMRLPFRFVMVVALASSASFTISTAALAQPNDPTAAPSASGAPTPPRAPSKGLAVLAMDGATDAAWALASKVYGDPDLRPLALDDVHARVLAGEAPAANAPQDVKDLAQIRAAVHGDDAPSRQLLSSLASQLGTRGVVVVEVAAGGAVSARVFVADAHAFDAARYAPDDPHTMTWNGATLSLSRAFGSRAAPSTTIAPPVVVAPTAEVTPAIPPTMVPGPPGILSDSPPVAAHVSKSFYQSGWFWGAVGAAVFAGGALFFATRDSSGQTIHLDVQVPH
jgi:hypothetical protein